MSRSYLNVVIMDQSSWSPDEKCSFFNYECTLRGGIYILNHQRAASNVHTTLGQFEMPNYWHTLYVNNKLEILIGLNVVDNL